MSTESRCRFTGVHRSRRVIAGLTARKSLRSGALWGVGVRSVRHGVLARVRRDVQDPARTRTSSPAPSARTSASTPSSARAHHIDTVAGFTAWRCVGVLSIVGGSGACLPGTRLLRGEEDAGRWELLLVGQTTRRGAAAQALAGLAAGIAALWSVTAVITASCRADRRR